jgi:hypothetical protein
VEIEKSGNWAGVGVSDLRGIEDIILAKVREELEGFFACPKCHIMAGEAKASLPSSRALDYGE